MAGDGDKEFQIVVFGATGYTGKYVTAEIKRVISNNANASMKWAVAGRSIEKLTESLKEVENVHGVGTVSNIPKIVADVNNYFSLVAMATRASVVINCVGPYDLHGEQVVRACIESGTSHIDISGEQIFLDRIQLNYDTQAKEAGVFIVGSCGFDSIPSDIGILYMQKIFKGDLHSVEGYPKYVHGVSGTMGNIGTFRTAVNGVTRLKQVRTQQKNLFPVPFPVNNHPLPRRKPMFYSEDIRSWCHMFPGCDASVVKRSQYRFFVELNKRPVQYHVYTNSGSFLSTLLTVVGFIFFKLMCQTSFTRYLILKFPRFFTAGAFSNEGPSFEKVQKSSFSFTFVGNGYSTVITDPNVPHDTPPDSRMITQITAPEMGYMATSISAVQSALLILQERDKLPHRGGVYTPAGAFRDTSIIERLESRGFKFNIIEPQHPV